MKVVDNVQGKTLQEIIDQYFVPKTKVECDGYKSYLNLEGVELNTKKYETDDLHWVHKAIAACLPAQSGLWSRGQCSIAYDALTKDQKNLVTNVKKLTDAETAYAKLTASEEDKEKAQEVIDLIDKLKDVTPDSEKDIEAARKAYDALTDLQKKLVDNYDVLTTAETKLAIYYAASSAPTASAPPPTA